MVVGAPVEDNNAASETDGNSNENLAENTGTAYVFNRNDGIWSQQVYLQAFNTEATNNFGTSVAISDSAVVVGAPGNNKTTDVEGNQVNNLSGTAGTAYVYTQNGSIWSQLANLGAVHADVDDRFGHAIVIADNTVVVGAANEDSNATVIDGDQGNNLADGAGAAYAFAIPAQQTVANQGLWWIPSKPGSGFDIGINSNNDLYMIWYTYTLDGKPIWYLASAPLNGSDWNADLFEFTWDGNTAISNRVGDAQLTFQDTTHATLNWTLDTGNGSTDIEYFMFDQGSNVSAGTWFDAAQPGYGLTQVNQGTTQVNVLYFYDQAGNPTWALGSTPATTPITNMDSFTGTCPVCPFESSVATTAGTVTTSFSGQLSGVLSTNINLLSPLLGSWQIFEATISNLSE